MERILQYIQKKYSPQSVILYGSYASGSNHADSDFDALVLSDEHPYFHDTSLVSGIRMDVFVYPADFFSEPFDCEDFIQIFDGRILMDRDGRGKMLQEKVLSYLKTCPRKTPEECKESVDWCVKMFTRTRRQDAEGLFRWHWLLTDSLEIFCDLMNYPYFGPKKALKWLEQSHPEAFACYKNALEKFDAESLENWIRYIKNTGETLDFPLSSGYNDL